MQSEARVATAAAQRYIKRLCKHFAHKVEATHTENHGRAEFPFGDCEMTAEMTAAPGVLILHAEADSEDALRTTCAICQQRVSVQNRNSKGAAAVLNGSSHSFTGRKATSPAVS